MRRFCRSAEPWAFPERVARAGAEQKIQGRYQRGQRHTGTKNGQVQQGPHIRLIGEGL